MTDSAIPNQTEGTISYTKDMAIGLVRHLVSEGTIGLVAPKVIHRCCDSIKESIDPDVSLADQKLGPRFSVAHVSGRSNLMSWATSLQKESDGDPARMGDLVVAMINGIYEVLPAFSEVKGLDFIEVDTEGELDDLVYIIMHVGDYTF